MEKDKEELFNNIMSSLNIRLDVQSVGNMISEDLKGYYFQCSRDYDALTLNEFFTLYKINLLEDKKIITCEVRELLEKIFYRRRELNRKIGDLAYKELFSEKKTSSKRADDLYRKVAEIDSVLAKYHLIMNDEEYQKMLVHGIVNEDFTNLPQVEEIKHLVKEPKNNY